MIDDVLLCKTNQANITHYVDIRFGGVQRDQFGSFFDARGGGINPCRLTPHIMDRREAVKKNCRTTTDNSDPSLQRTRTDNGYRQGAPDITAALWSNFSDHS